MTSGSSPDVGTTKTLAALAARCLAWTFFVGLLGFDVQLLHQAGVCGEIAVNELRECVGAAADRLLAGLQEAVADRRLGERLVDLGVETHADRRRRSRRHQHADPLL